MSFTSTNFHDLLDPDLWVIEQMLTLPSDPDPKTTQEGNKIHIKIVDTVAMPQMQQAVSDYRRRILPAIFIVSQKIYAELFRFVLYQCGGSAGNRQYDVEREVTMIISNNRLSTYHPFIDETNFQNWWSGKYSFSSLRSARNQVVHSNYTFNDSLLVVSNESGAILMDWTESEIIDFADEVLRITKKV